MAKSMEVAVVTDVFYGEGCEERLDARLKTAARRGATLAVLPELPFDPWVAVYRQPREEDCEPPDGPRARLLSEAAAKRGISVLGGAIVRDPETGRRANTALLVGADGALIARYQKVHLPEEEGYWETAHYEPGQRAPEPIDLDGFPVGIQICSDANRQGAQLLSAAGAFALLAPRATPPGTYDRWRLVLRAMAATGAVYVLSVNRPEEPGAPNGGPTLVVAPDGSVLAETHDPVVCVTLRGELVEAARRSYPGYLSYAPEVYSEGWKALGG